MFACLITVNRLPFNKISNSLLSLCLLNSRSVRNKSAAIYDYLCECKADLIAVTETWLNNHDNAVRAELCPDGYSPLWKRVTAWVESSCPSDCGKVWGDVGYCHRIQRPPKQSHNHLGSYSRPRLSLFSKVGYKLLDHARTCRQGGGTALLFRDSLPVKKVDGGSKCRLSFQNGPSSRPHLMIFVWL